MTTFCTGGEGARERGRRGGKERGGGFSCNKSNEISKKKQKRGASFSLLLFWCNFVLFLLNLVYPLPIFFLGFILVLAVAVVFPLFFASGVSAQRKDVSVIGGGGGEVCVCVMWQQQHWSLLLLRSLLLLFHSQQNRVRDTKGTGNKKHRDTQSGKEGGKGDKLRKTTLFRPGRKGVGL